MKILELSETGFADVPCREGYEIRIETLIAEIAAVSQDDQIRWTFRTNGDKGPLLLIITATATSSTEQVSAARGLQQTPLIIVSQTPVTGEFNYDQIQTAMTPLPETWWDVHLHVGFSANAASFVNGRLTYTERRIARA